MSAAFEQSEGDNPFDASYEEYVRAFGHARTTSANDPFAPDDDSDDEVEETPDDPEVTQASAKSADFDQNDAPWGSLSATQENDPFASVSASEAEE